jgi:ABC-type cobalamin/Fe3+-siderophores transport system ATPase subunit
MRGLGTSNTVRHTLDSVTGHDNQNDMGIDVGSSYGCSTHGRGAPRCRPHDHQAIEQVLAQTDLQTLHHHLITELSGSGQRRVILARTLEQQAQILLLGHP